MTEVAITRRTIELYTGGPPGADGANGADAIDQIVFCDVSGTANAITLTPRDGFDLEASAAEQYLAFTVGSTPTAGISIVLTGLNDGDPRQVRLADGTSTVPVGTLSAGCHCILKFHEVGTPRAGLFELIAPAPASTTQQPLVMCGVTGTANALILTPSTGYAASGDGSAQLFGGVAAFDNTAGVSVVVTGLNTGDPRNAFLPGGASVSIPAGTIQAGEYVEFKYVAATGLFEMTCPGAGSAATPQPLIDCTVTGTNSLVFTPKAGYAVSGGGVSQRFYGKAANDNTAGINAEVIGANTGDPRNVYLPGASAVAVPVGLIQAGELIEIKYVEATGYFELVHPTVQAEESEGVTSTTEFYAAANSRIYAQAAFGK